MPRRSMLFLVPGLALSQVDISWVGGDVSWFETSINWSPDVPANSYGGVVQISNGADVTVDSAARVNASVFRLAESGSDVTKLIVQSNLCIGASCPVCPGGVCSEYTRGDPHITFANGGQADFRGSHRAYYCFASSPGFQFAPYFQESDFWFNRPELGLKQLVHGTFMTRASWRVKTSSGRELVVTADAMNRGEATIKLQPTATQREVESVALKPRMSKSFDDVKISTEMLTVSVETSEWTINVTSKPIYGLVQPIINETHVHGRWLVDQRRFDVVVTGVYPNPEAHGVVGQSFRGGAMKPGRLDDYDIEHRPELASSEGMLPPFTTSAQAEGALEGVYTDYKLPSAFSTGFKYSAYSKQSTVWTREKHEKREKRTATAQEALEVKGWWGKGVKKEL